MAALMRTDACNISFVSFSLACSVTSMVCQIVVSFCILLNSIFLKASLPKRCINSCFFEHERFKQEAACRFKPLSKQHFTQYSLEFWEGQAISVFWPCYCFLAVFCFCSWIFSAASLSHRKTVTVRSNPVSAIKSINLPPFKAFQVFYGKLFLMTKVLFLNLKSL